MIELGIWSGIGLLTGLLAGLVPGAGPFVAIGVLYPFLASTSAVNIMACYVAILITTNYTNSVTAILYGIPGDATAISTARYGHKMFQKGAGGLAVTSNAISSTVGVAFAMCLFLVALPSIMHVFKFYNSIIQTIVILVAICMITFFTKQNKLLTLLLFCFGGLISHQGIDPITFDQFLVFNNFYLSLGIPFASVMIGLYLFPEILKIHNISISQPSKISKYAIGKGTFGPSLLGSFIGFWCGLIPGITNILGSYASAGIVKRFFKKPVLKSIAAAEAANNSGALSSLLPLLILAIPITGSEVIVYYLMLESGYQFNIENTVDKLSSILYFIPVVTLICLLLSWYGFNLLGQIVYLYKQYRVYANTLILTTISVISVVIFPIHEWMVACILIAMVLGYFLRNYDTSPVIYGYFLSDLFYESFVRTVIILS